MQFIRKWGMMDGRGCLWSSLCQSNMAVLPTHSANCSPFYPVLKGDVTWRHLYPPWGFSEKIMQEQDVGH